MSEQEQELDHAAIYERGYMIINGTQYDMLDMPVDKGQEVAAFFSSIIGELQQGSLAFYADPRFKKVKDLLERYFTVDDMLLSKTPNHWKKHKLDYQTFITVGMAVASYPFTVAPTLS